MIRKITTAGNSLVIGIPKKEAKHFGWGVGQTVMVDVSADRVVIMRLPEDKKCVNNGE